MKLYGMDLPLHVNRQTPPPPRGRAGTFNEILAGQVNALDKTADRSSDPGTSQGKTAVLDRGDDILTLLETYAADLNDPCKTLKQMAPLVSVIEQEVAQFEKNADEQTSLDAELKGWVDDLSLTARVATAKFFRGDFL
jgi:hypothetical protein